MSDPDTQYTLYGTEDQPLGNTSVTTSQEVQIDFIIPAGGKSRHLVQLYTDQDVYFTLTSGGTATPNSCELIPGGSFRNITVSGIQGAGVAKSVYLLGVSSNANVRLAEVRILRP